MQPLLIFNTIIHFNRRNNNLFPAKVHTYTTCVYGFLSDVTIAKRKHFPGIKLVFRLKRFVLMWLLIFYARELRQYYFDVTFSHCWLFKRVQISWYTRYINYHFCCIFYSFVSFLVQFVVNRRINSRRLIIDSNCIK